MDLSLTMLGTGATVPTKARALPAQLIQYGSTRILVDCGEGTQRQMIFAGESSFGLDAILLTHWHADHYLGLFGLLKTLSFRERTEPLLLAGPRGFGRYIREHQGGMIGRLGFELDVVEVGDDSIEANGFSLVSRISDHGRASAVAWAFVEDDRPARLDAAKARELGVPSGPLMGQLARGEDVEVGGRLVLARDLIGQARPGRKIVISGDTRPCDGVRELAHRANILVHEATFLASDHNDDGSALARAKGHSTAAEAALLAVHAGPHLTVLSHISTRYPSNAVLSEARRAGRGLAVCVARDLDRYEVPLADRGMIKLVRDDRVLSPIEAAI